MFSWKDLPGHRYGTLFGHTHTQLFFALSVLRELITCFPGKIYQDIDMAHFLDTHTAVFCTVSLTGINDMFSWKDLPGHRYGTLFVGRLCNRRAEDLLKFSKHQLKMAVAVLTGHAPVRRHLYIMGLFDGDPTCRFCRMEAETVQHIICYCEVLAQQRYNVFGKLFAGPKDISTASVRDLCLFIRGTGLLNLC
jgi:hypothetical protein